MNNALVSVCLITYNHVDYIKEAIEGVINQKTDFYFELIIADDFSTDGTREILIEYKHKYPDLIKLILQEKNLGAASNWEKLITYPNTKYIAYFEGDDYWCDNYKLQTQIDFLEQNVDFSMCFHKTKVINENKNNELTYFPSKVKNIYTGEDLLRQWLMATSSVVFRNKLPKSLPNFMTKYTHGDLALYLYISQFGFIGYFDRVMSVYRVNITSITSNYKGIEHIEKHIAQCVEMLEFFKPRFQRGIRKRLANYSLNAAMLFAKNKNNSKSILYLKDTIKYSPYELIYNYKVALKLIYYTSIK